MKKVLIASGIAVLAFAMVAGAQAYTFNSNLTVGSTGPDVVALQQWLVNNHYLTMPTGVAMGFFGSKTKTAVAAYQVAAGIANPGTGFVGPLTRKALNAGGVVGPAVSSACPAGYDCYLKNSTGTVTGAGSSGITTPGIPGIMTVTAGPLSSSVLHVGDQMVAIESLRVQAQYSDVDVQSLTLDIGNNTAFYNKLFNTIYVTDGTNVLASTPVNGTTVVQSGSEYLLGVAGFHFVVPKGTYKDLIIKGSLNSSVDSNYTSASGTYYPDGSGTAQNSVNGTAVTGWAIGITANGLRGVDGAGLNLYGPTTGMYQTLTINSSLVDQAQANISLDAASPQASSVPVSDTTNGQYLGFPVLVFDVNAQYDTLHLRTVNVGVCTASGGTGTVGAAYLFQGTTQIASASVSNCVATFSNISNGTAGATIPVNTTVPFTVKVDVTGVTSGTLTITGSTTATQTILSSNDSSATINGTATGNAQVVSSAGPLITLSGTPTITATNISAPGSGNTIYKYVATFNLNVQAIGENVVFNLPGVTYGSFGTSTTGNDVAQVYQDSSAISTTTIASYSNPTNTTLSSNGQYFTLAQNQQVTIPVTYSFTVTNPAGHVYAVQLNGVKWAATIAGSTSTASFMSGLPQWRTASI